MRWQTVIVLMALAFTIMVPPSFSLVIGHDNQPVLGTLDVCHTGTPALASNGEMPCMNECTCGRIRTSSIAYTKQIDPLFSEFLLVTRHERPPQI